MPDEDKTTGSTGCNCGCVVICLIGSVALWLFWQLVFNQPS